MVHKFKLIFLLSLTLLSILGTTSFALTPSNQMNAETMQDILNWISQRNSESFNTFMQNVNIENLTRVFNETISGDIIPYLENITLATNKDSSGNIQLKILPNNNTLDVNLPFLGFREGVSGYDPTRTFRWTTSDGTEVYPNKYYNITFNEDGTFLISELSTNTLRIIAAYSTILDDGSTINTPSTINLGIHGTFYARPYGESTYLWYLGDDYIPIYTEDAGGEDGGGGDTGGNTGSTGTITNPSGETTGNVDLSGIQSGISDINNNLGNIQDTIPTSGDMQNIISGEVGKITETITKPADFEDKNITNEDITNNLDFEFMEDPYSNFWLELTTGLSGALTNNIRTLDINWLGHIHTIDLDKIGLKYPPSMELILKSTSTVAIVWVLVKWWKIIVDKLSSGNMDEVLAMNEEERNY